MKSCCRDTISKAVEILNTVLTQSDEIIDLLSSLRKLKENNKPLYIRTLMAAKSGVRPLDLCIKLGVSAAMMSRVMHDHRVSKPIQQAIADVCGVPYEHLWAERSGKQHRTAAFIKTS